MAVGMDWQTVKASLLNHLSRFISLCNFDVKFLNRFTVGSSIPAACKPDDGVCLVGLSDSLDSLDAARRCNTMPSQS